MSGDWLVLAILLLPSIDDAIILHVEFVVVNLQEEKRPCRSVLRLNDCWGVDRKTYNGLSVNLGLLRNSNTFP